MAYTVLSGDTLTSIATNLTSAINANTNLQAVNVSATSSGTVVFVKSSSINATSYAKSLSGGATETIALAPSTSANLYSYNNLNELTSIAAGGPTKFEGNANKALTAASVNSNPANLQDSLKFDASPSLSSATNTLPVAVTDANSTTVTNSYRVATNGSASATPTFDANGNMTSDGTNLYVWDADSTLMEVVYPGSDNKSTLKYDARGALTEIKEISNGVVVGYKKLVNNGLAAQEIRDNSNIITKLLFSCGERIGASNSFHTSDHLGSRRSITNQAGDLVSSVEYDICGQVCNTSGLLDSEFLFADLYLHARSKLYLTYFRAYNPSTANWLSRDPLGEENATNLYPYSENDPVNFLDPLGLKIIISGTSGYMSQVKTDLAQLREAGLGDVIDRLDQSPMEIEITDVQGPTTWTQAHENSRAYRGENGSPGRGSGSNILYNPKFSSGTPENKYVCKKGCRNRPIALAHELGHALRNLKGITVKEPVDEKYPMQLENIARRYYCAPIRKKY